MIIYADILFFINACVTYITLLLSALILKSPFKRRRLLLSSFIGGIYALSILTDMPALLSFGLKVFMCIALIFIAFGKLQLKTFLVHVLLFLSMNVLIGGVVLLLSLADKNEYYSNLSVHYINVSPLHLLIALVIAYFGVHLFTRLMQKRQLHSTIYKVCITHGGADYILFGFCDTGNNLSEPFSSLPVCLIKPGVLERFDADDKKRVIPYTCLGGEGVIYAVKAQISVELKTREIIQTQVYLAQSADAFKETQFDIILHPKIFTYTESL